MDNVFVAKKPLRNPSGEQATQDRAPVWIRQDVCIVADHIYPADETALGNPPDCRIGDPGAQRVSETMQRNHHSLVAELNSESKADSVSGALVLGSYVLLGNGVGSFSAPLGAA